MVKNLKLAYKVVTNIANIKLVVESVYNVIIKVLNVIDFIKAQTDEYKDSKLGKLLAQYVPLVETALTKVKLVIEKYGKLIGIETIVYSQDNEDIRDALLDALKELDAVVTEK